MVIMTRQVATAATGIPTTSCWLPNTSCKTWMRKWPLWKVSYYVVSHPYNTLTKLLELEMMEDEVERLQRGITMRDRVIKRLHDEIEEKDAVCYSPPHLDQSPFYFKPFLTSTQIIQALPYELVSNWAAASHMMMGQ